MTQPHRDSERPTVEEMLDRLIEIAMVEGRLRDQPLREPGSLERTVEERRAARSALVSRWREMERDSERLDFLQRKCYAVMGNPLKVSLWLKESVEETSVADVAAGTYREAIDQARVPALPPDLEAAKVAEEDLGEGRTMMLDEPGALEAFDRTFSRYDPRFSPAPEEER